MRRALLIFSAALVAAFLVPALWAQEPTPMPQPQSCFDPATNDCRKIPPPWTGEPQTCKDNEWSVYATCEQLCEEIPKYCPIYRWPFDYGFCRDRGTCFPVPSIFGTIEGCAQLSTVPCTSTTPTPTPRPTPVQGQAVPVSWDPGQRTLCIRGFWPGTLPSYLSQCYGEKAWFVDLETPGVGANRFDTVTLPDGAWQATLYTANANDPPATGNNRWTGMALMTPAWVETSRDLWITATVKYDRACCATGDDRAAVMFMAKANGKTYEVDLDVGGHWGDADPRPAYIVTPQPYPNGIDAWVVLDGRAWGFWLTPGEPKVLLIPLTRILDAISRDNPTTFPAPSGGWTAAGILYHFGVGIETFEASWCSLEASGLTLWAGDPSQMMRTRAPRRHLERRK